MTYPREPFAGHLKSMVPRRSRAGGWQQGEHVLISGPTGSGKTTLAAALLKIRSHSVMMVSKLNDPTFAAEFADWERWESWPARPDPNARRVLLWPRPVKNDMEATIAKQREVFKEAANRLLSQGKRCVCVDEMLYASDPKYLNMSKEIGMLHYTGRSAGISMVTLTQRPSWIPRVIMSSISHAYIARTFDKDDAKRLSDLGGVDAKAMAENFVQLPDRHDYVYANPQGDMAERIVNTRR